MRFSNLTRRLDSPRIIEKWKSSGEKEISDYF